MTEEERKDYLKYIENYTINDLSDIFNTQNFVIQDKDKFNEILLNICLCLMFGGVFGAIILIIIDIYRKN